MKKVNISIVRYNQQEDELIPIIDVLKGCNNINDIFIIDNSPVYSPILNKLSIEYIFNDANIGYGAAHNKAIKRSIEGDIPYHIVLNPDITLTKDTISVLLSFMELNKDVGLVMPKIVYEDGSIQYLCKMLSTPFDLLGRRFLIGPLSVFYRKRLYKYELHHKDYEKEMDVPNLSGCFMFLRTNVLVKSGLFDSRFFMYLEDIDLTRRIHQYARTVYYPNAVACHGYAKGSYKSFKLFYFHTRSAVKYFNKWGWLFDTERKRINAQLNN
jgi:GT2 family glycosyltransferase